MSLQMMRTPSVCGFRDGLDETVRGASGGVQPSRQLDQPLKRTKLVVDVANGARLAFFFALSD